MVEVVGLDTDHRLSLAQEFVLLAWLIAILLVIQEERTIGNAADQMAALVSLEVT